MKSLFFFLLVILNISTPSEGCDTLKTNGPIGWVPIVYRDTNDNLTGVAVDVAKKVFDSLNVRLEIQPHIPWKRQLKKLKNGSLDMIIAAYHSDERAGIYEYSVPFAYEKIGIFTHRDRQFKINSKDDLIGKLGLRPRGGTYGSEFDQFAKDNLDFIEFSDKKKSLELLYSGRADYLVLSFNDGLLNAKRFGFQDEIVLLNHHIAETSIHFLFSKKSPCKSLLSKTNSELSKLVRDKEIGRIEKKFNALN